MNPKVIQIFTEISEMLEVLGENVFRVRAYQRAAEMVRSLGEDLEDMHLRNDQSIEKLPGIGLDLHAKIVEILETGSCEMHTRLLKKLGPGILNILRIRGIGPKKVKLFMEQLDIRSLDQLLAAAESGALAGLPGMGAKSQAGILEAVKQMTHLQERVPYAKARRRAEDCVKFLEECKAVKKVTFAGSLRRKRATIGDIDIVATGKNLEEIMAYFLTYPKIKQVLGAGETKSSVVTEDNMQIDLRVVEAESFGAALFYFTGPKHFNIHVRTLALKRGWKINEYGLFEGTKKIAGRTEEEMFEALCLPYLTPEKRESFK